MLPKRLKMVFKKENNKAYRQTYRRNKIMKQLDNVNTSNNNIEIDYLKNSNSNIN